MRVKEIADLVGTTVRTVRHYHQVGLLPVPELRYGYRDYDLRHVARLSRIRWLAASGVSLQTVAETLGADSFEPPRDAILADLRASLAAAEEELSGLQTRRDRLAALVATVETDGTLSPAPAAVLKFYDELEARSRDESTRREVRRERDFVELAYFRGDAPPGTELLYTGFDEHDVAASLVGFEEAVSVGLSEEEVERVGAANAARILRAFNDGDADQASTPVDLTAVRRLYELFMATADERGRTMGEAVMRHLVAAVENGRVS